MLSYKEMSKEVLIAHIQTMDMQLNAFAKSSYEKDLRIAELEAQIAAASALVVEQNPIGYTCQYDLDCLANYNNVTIFPELDKDISPIALYTAPKAADTDKLREEILALRVDPPRRYDNAQISAFCLGAKVMSEAAADLAASTALQAPVGDGTANDTAAVQAILDGNRLQAPVREVPEPIQWTYGSNVWKDWCSHYFGPDSDDTYLAEAVFNLPPMAQKFKTQWISVEERLPEVRDDSVLALFNHGGIDMVHLQEYFGDITNGYSDEGEQRYTQYYKSAGITHWCALPAAPVQPNTDKEQA